MSSSFNENCWDEAEKTVLAELCTALGVPNNNSLMFIGKTPKTVDTASLSTGDLLDVETVWNEAGNITSIHVRANVDGRFTSRTKALSFLTRFIQAQPLNNIDNVHLFRIAPEGICNATEQLLPVANSTSDRLFWVVTIGCELIFTTGTKQE